MRVVGRLLAARNARLGRPLRDDELEDLTQETLLLVWRKLEGFAGRASLETWVYRFCYLELMNWLRKKSRLPRPLSELSDDSHAEPVAPAAAEPGEDVGLESILRHLAPREAEVIRLRHVEQCTPNEICELLAISLSSVKTHYYRGLEKLRSVLKKGGEGGTK